MKGLGLETFLQTKTSKGKLMVALEVIQEFKACESKVEWYYLNFDTRARLEQLEEMLEKLIKK